MIYQTLITARWKPHLLSWCMVMIAPRHRLPWILTNALLSSPLVSSLSLSLSSSFSLSEYIYLFCAAVLFSVALHHFLFGFTRSLFVCLSVSNSRAARSLTSSNLPFLSIFGYCFHFWAIPSMPLLIPGDTEKSVVSCSPSFHLSVPFCNERHWCGLGQYWSAARC